MTLKTPQVLGCPRLCALSLRNSESSIRQTMDPNELNQLVQYERITACDRPCIVPLRRYGGGSHRDRRTGHSLMSLNSLLFTL